MKFLLDIIFLVFYALFIFTGIKRGLIKSLIDMFGSFLSFAAASTCAGLCCVWVYDNIIRDTIINSMINSMPENIMALSGQSASSLITYLPENIASSITAFGLDKLFTGISLPDAGLTIANIESTYVAPIVQKLVKAVLAFVIYFIFKIIIRLITGVISDIVHKTFLKSVDKALGGVFGALKGVLSVGIVVCIVIFVSSFFTDTAFGELVAESSVCSVYKDIAGALFGIGG